PAVAVEVHSPHVSSPRGRVRRGMREVAQRNRYLHHPVLILVRIIVQGSHGMPGDLHALSVPSDAWTVRSLGPMVVNKPANHIPFDIEVEIGTRAIGRHHDFKTIVLGNRAVSLGVARRDKSVLADVT